MKKRYVVLLLAGLLVMQSVGNITKAAETNIGADKSEEKKSVTQEELDKLKKTLQKELDKAMKAYENGSWFDLDFGLNFSSSKNICYEEAVCEEDVYEETDEASYALASPAMVDYPDFNTEEYGVIKEKGFVPVLSDPLSTFAADVDTGSFCNLRRMIQHPDSYEMYTLDTIPSGSVRTEEMLNYFDYEVNERSDGKFSVQYETADCPWTEGHKLLLMTAEANEVEVESKGNNFVYLIDTSGSMDEPYKFLLAKCAFKLLSYTLTGEDRVSIVTYAGDSYVALDSVPGDDYAAISRALDQIKVYGGTNGSGGITAAYELAEKNFIEGGNNRVIIASDGDMNLGITSTSGLVDLIKEKKETGVFLTVLGFGSGNYSDLNMESIADAGNGNYFYIDGLDEAQHVLIENQKQTTITVAKDVKFQAEFNPYKVSSYRLLGYENREVADHDFKNDSVDGGEVGAGAQVTVMYELIMSDGAEAEETGSDLKYQNSRTLSDAAETDELLTLSINYKNPADQTSETESYAITETEGEASPDMHLAISLSELAMLLHHSEYAEDLSLEEILSQAELGQKDKNIYRAGYLYMLEDLIKMS